jgi:hypothetical protein
MESRRKRRIDAGLCSNCPRVLDTKYTVCQRCLDYRNDRRRELVSQGLCPRHKLPILPSYTERCQRCVDSWRLRVWKLTPEQYAEKKQCQDYKCAICKQNFVGEPSIDHDHRCCAGVSLKGKPQSCGKCVRDLLCDTCNHGLGSFMENPEILRAAADYVERWQKVKENQHG